MQEVNRVEKVLWLAVPSGIFHVQQRIWCDEILVCSQHHSYVKWNMLTVNSTG